MRDIDILVISNSK